jgi:hypothetical protein
VIEFLRSARNAAGKIVVRSALNPLLWLGIIGAGLLLSAAYEFSGVPVLARYCGLLIVSSLLLLFVPAAIGVGFAIYRPDKLQSEEYQLRQQAITVIQQMGGAPQIFDTASIVAIANPALREMGAAREPEPEAVPRELEAAGGDP